MSRAAPPSRRRPSSPAPPPTCRFSYPSLAGLTRVLLDGPNADPPAARAAAAEAERVAPVALAPRAVAAQGWVALFDGDLDAARRRAADAVRAARSGRQADLLAESLELVAAVSARPDGTRAALTGGGGHLAPRRCAAGRRPAARPAGPGTRCRRPAAAGGEGGDRAAAGPWGTRRRRFAARAGGDRRRHGAGGGAGPLRGARRRPARATAGVAVAAGPHTAEDPGGAAWPAGPADRTV